MSRAAVLLGDAAHPMLQCFAQGACEAMKDAVCVSHILESYPDAAGALSCAALSARRRGATVIACD